MISAGIDIGAKTVKVVLVRDGEVLARSKVPAGIDTRAANEEAMDKAWANLPAHYQWLKNWEYV